MIEISWLLKEESTLNNSRFVKFKIIKIVLNIFLFYSHFIENTLIYIICIIFNYVFFSFRFEKNWKSSFLKFITNFAQNYFPQFPRELMKFCNFLKLWWKVVVSEKPYGNLFIVGEFSSILGKHYVP